MRIFENYEDIVQQLSEIKDNDLIRLVYVSRMTRQTKKKAWLEQRYDDCYQFNCQNKITGFYCTGDDCLFECLEGKKIKVLGLIDGIFLDERHKKVKVILTRPVAQNHFEEWHLYYTPLSKKLKPQEYLPDVLQQYLPFRPIGWPLWYIEYFIDTISQFKGVNGKHHFRRDAPMRLPQRQLTVADIISEQPLLVDGVLLIMVIIMGLLAMIL